MVLYPIPLVISKFELLSIYHIFIMIFPALSSQTNSQTQYICIHRQKWSQHSLYILSVENINPFATSQRGYKKPGAKYLADLYKIQNLNIYKVRPICYPRRNVLSFDWNCLFWLTFATQHSNTRRRVHFLWHTDTVISREDKKINWIKSMRLCPK